MSGHGIFEMVFNHTDYSLKNGCSNQLNGN